jgi:hypothetical protein
MTITPQTKAVVEGVVEAVRDHTDRIFEVFDQRIAAVERAVSALAARIAELENRTERDKTNG